MNMESQIHPRFMDVGDLLLANGAISEELLVAVRAQQQESGASTAQCLVSAGNISEEIVIRSLAELEHVEFHPLNTYQAEEKLIRSIPAKLIFHYEMLPLFVDDGGISIAFGDLPDPLELGNLRLLLGKRINVVLAPPARIRAQFGNALGLALRQWIKLRKISGHPKRMSSGSTKSLPTRKAESARAPFPNSWSRYSMKP